MVESQFLNFYFRTKTTNLPYYSWSHLLADLIESTHKDLCNIICQPQSVGCTLSILQCLAIFLSSTPYHRMNNGILKAVAQALNPLLKHAGNIESYDYFSHMICFSLLIIFSDSTVRMAAIKCLTEIVVLECTTEEQISLVCYSNCDEYSKFERKSWIVCYCLESIKVSVIHNCSLRV